MPGSAKNRRNQPRRTWPGSAMKDKEDKEVERGVAGGEGDGKGAPYHAAGAGSTAPGPALSQLLTALLTITSHECDDISLSSFDAWTALRVAADDAAHRFLPDAAAFVVARCAFDACFAELLRAVLARGALPLWFGFGKSAEEEALAETAMTEVARQGAAVAAARVE